MSRLNRLSRHCAALALAVSVAVQAAPAPEPAPPAQPPSAAATESERIPFRRDTQSLPEQSLSAVLTTVLLLGAMGGGLYYLRRHLQNMPRKGFLRPSGIEIVERAHANAKLSLYVVRYRGKEVLLAHSGSNVTALAEYPDSGQPFLEQSES